MADLTDVQTALASVIAATIYPNGTAQPSVIGAPVAVYPGWPIPVVLDADLAALSSGGGHVHISVFPTAIERKTTRFSNAPQQLTAPVQTLALAINSQQVTVSGTVSTPQNVMVMVNKLPYVYAVQANDTLTTIATALATMIPGATNSGSVITLPAASVIQAARVGATASLIAEVRRQEHVIKISVWADTPARRDAAIQAIDPVLAGIEFLTMPDGFGARLIYRSTYVEDGVQKAGVYRRDLDYSVEYATTVVTNAVQVTQEQFNTSVPNTSTVTTYQ